ncbi:hypothetical protein WN48_04025 [Eufriesea mexicana]|uniref:Uncharacterized protein n=1 Tax=Eufriesea mexicana TaxID=516756 RepID=A0A310SLW8_9HYME|nr:hypothetical protein WN48_04025 [Eufriesea mexicana]
MLNGSAAYTGCPAVLASCNSETFHDGERFYQTKIHNVYFLYGTCEEKFNSVRYHDIAEII